MILDDLKGQDQLDRQNLYGSILALPQQCRHAFAETGKLRLPPHFRQVKQVIMTGMGGSGLGARIIESVYGDEIKLPLQRVNDYHLPAWAGQSSLVICSSFSGTTEETVNNAEEAHQRGCPWIAVSSGGQLIDLAKKFQAPYYQINPTYNPSKQPRMASGYLVVGQMVIAAKIGLIKFDETALKTMETTMSQVIKANRRELPLAKNPAKALAMKLKDRGVIFISARHLLGPAHVIKNQMNENAKNFSALFDLPELNHHLMEGLAHPAANVNDLFFVLIDSLRYEARIRERLAITQDVIAKNKIESVTLTVSGESEIAQAFHLIQFGSFVNYYLTLLYGLDPSPIPWVDYFKVKLGQSLGQWK